jgi:hypothetical protein
VHRHDVAAPFCLCLSTVHLLQLTAELTRPFGQLQDDAARWQSLGTGSLQSNLLSVQLLGSLPAGLSVKVGRMRCSMEVNAQLQHEQHTAWLMSVMNSGRVQQTAAGSATEVSGQASSGFRLSHACRLHDSFSCAV